jgi:hypothetical protein
MAHDRHSRYSSSGDSLHSWLSHRTDSVSHTALKVKSTIYDLLKTIAADKSLVYEDYYGFDVLLIPDEVIDRDEQLAALRKKYPFIAGITRMQPNTAYNWHKDTNRSGVVNMMIDHVNSHCLFTPEAEARVSEISELNYEPKTYHIFNTQVAHMVVNLEGYRYMFTLEFSVPVTYENLLDFFEVKNG